MADIHQITDRERELTFEITMLHKMVAEHKADRDALAAENVLLKKQLVDNDKLLEKASETLAAAALEIKQLVYDNCDLRDAVKLGLEALEPHKSTVLRWYTNEDRAIDARKEALGEQG